MELDALQAQLGHLSDQALATFHKIPGSAVLGRYIQSSYQNDPVRSAIELVLFLFFIRYLMAPSYSTHKRNFVKLREDVSVSLKQVVASVAGRARPPLIQRLQSHQPHVACWSQTCCFKTNC